MKICLTISSVTIGCVAALSRCRKSGFSNTSFPSLFRSISPVHYGYRYHVTFRQSQEGRGKWGCAVSDRTDVTIWLQYVGAERLDDSPVAPSALHIGRDGTMTVGLGACAADRPPSAQHTFCTTALAISSASTTGSPCVLNNVDTVLLPVAMPPVRPISFMLSSEIQLLVAANSAAQCQICS